MPQDLFLLLEDMATRTQRSVSSQILYLITTHDKVKYGDYVELEDD